MQVKRFSGLLLIHRDSSCRERYAGPEQLDARNSDAFFFIQSASDDAEVAFERASLDISLFDCVVRGHDPSVALVLIET